MKWFEGLRGASLIVMLAISTTILIWGGKFGDAATSATVFMAVIALASNYLGQRKGGGSAPGNGKEPPKS